MRRTDAVTSGGGRALYINREKRRKRKRIVKKLIGWGFLILLVCIAFFMVKKTFSFVSGFSADDYTFDFDIPQAWSEHDTVTEVKKNYAVAIAYPVINEKTDKSIQKDTEKMLEDFIDEIKESKPGKKENRCVYTTNYSVTKNSDNYVSVVYKTNRVNPVREINDIQFKTRIYDISTGKALSREEIFTENFAPVVSRLTVDYFQNNSEYADETYTNLFKKNTEPKAENFSEFSFNDSSLTLYFGAGKIFPSDMGEVTVDIPLSKLYNDMKINITGYEPPRYDPDKPMIALTFDDGPNRSSTSVILDALESTGSRATFFVLGERVAGETETMKRASSIGCEYGNHTWSHEDLTKLTPDKIAEQVKKTDDALVSAIGKESRFLRAPYAATNDTVFQTLEKPFVGWSIDTEDWKNKDSAAIVSHVLNNVSDGDIVLMHDLYSSTANAAAEIISTLTGEGYQLVTVSELLEARGITPAPDKIYYSARKKK